MQDSDDDEDFAFDCIDDGNFQFDDEDLKFAFDYLDDGDTDDGDTDDRDIDDDDIDDEDIDDGGISNGDINDAVVKRIEEVWSMCALKKVDLSICVGLFHSISAVSKSTLPAYTFQS